MIKTRFAPSPTGLIHLGNARTALFSYLFARNQGGVFLLRIEDTDVERSKEEYDFALRKDLHWLGLVWQEGPGMDDGKGPYHQSKRQAIYDDYYQRLEEADQAYPCFCTEEQLALMRKVQRASGKPPRYAGTCRALTSEEREQKIAHGLRPTLRFRIPDDEVVTFVDLVRGEQRFNTNDIGDFIIRRANGTSPFLFCSVIDDALMGVTHVFRGEDHLTNTPRQILILQALSLSVPHYGHISLIVGSDGSPLSKRHGSRSIQELRTLGYLPDAVVNYMARLGHYYERDDFMTAKELAENFRVESLSKSPAKFDASQLEYWQKRAVERLSEKQFLDWIGEKTQQLIPEKEKPLFIETIKHNVLFPENVDYWARVCFEDNLTHSDEHRQLLHAVGEKYFTEALTAFKKFDNNLKEVIGYLKENTGLKGPALYKPLRIALTGSEHGPELEKLIVLIGHDKVHRRLQKARA